VHCLHLHYRISRVTNPRPQGEHGQNWWHDHVRVKKHCCLGQILLGPQCCDDFTNHHWMRAQKSYKNLEIQACEKHRTGGSKRPFRRSSVSPCHEQTGAARVWLVLESCLVHSTGVGFAKHSECRSYTEKEQNFDPVEGSWCPQPLVLSLSSSCVEAVLNMLNVLQLRLQSAPLLLLRHRLPDHDVQGDVPTTSLQLDRTALLEPKFTVDWGVAGIARL